MGHHFIHQRKIRSYYSDKRIFLLLHENNYYPHRIRGYGYGSKNYFARQMFQKKHSTRIGHKNGERVAKKFARRQTKHEIRAMEKERLDNQ